MNYNHYDDVDNNLVIVPYGKGHTSGFAVNTMTEQQLLDDYDKIGLTRRTPPVNTPASLEQVKADAKTLVDQGADSAATRYVTGGLTQGMRYQKKLEQAEAYKLAGYPADAAAYEFIKLEAEARGITYQVLADEVIALAAQWVTLGATIEAARVNGKQNIDGAVTVESVATLLDTTLNQLLAI